MAGGWRSGWFGKGKGKSSTADHSQTPGQDEHSPQEPRHSSASQGPHVSPIVDHSPQQRRASYSSRLLVGNPTADRQSIDDRSPSQEHSVGDIGSSSVRGRTPDHSDVGGQSLVDPRICLIIVDGVLEPDDKIGRMLLKIFETRWYPEGGNWASLPESAVLFYFKGFKKHFRWDVTVDAWVYPLFKKRAAGRYPDIINALKTGKIKRKPRDDIWSQWKTYSESNEFKEKSTTNSKNRKSENTLGGGMSTHSFGSRRMRKHRAVSIEKHGRDPSPYALFTTTHSTTDEEGNVVPVCQKAREIAEVVKGRLEAATEDVGEGQTPTAIDEAKIYYDAVNGLSNKQRVYDIGTCGKTYYSDSYRSIASSSYPSFDAFQKMKDEMEQSMMRLMDEKLREEREIIR